MYMISCIDDYNVLKRRSLLGHHFEVIQLGKEFGVLFKLYAFPLNSGPQLWQIFSLAAKLIK